MYKIEDYEPKIQAYIKQIESGQMTSTNAHVIDYVQTFNGGDIDAMRKSLEIAHQTLTSAVSHLVDLGALYPVGTRTKKGRAYTIYYYQPSPFMQMANAEDVKRKKYTKLRERLLKDFPEFISKDLRRELTQETIL
jgi:predicted transcriptional regulator